MVPSGGLVYYLSPPHSLMEVATNPLHALFYTAFMLAASSGSTPTSRVWGHTYFT